LLLQNKPVDEFKNLGNNNKKKNHIPPVADLSLVTIPSQRKKACKIEEKRVPLNQTSSNLFSMVRKIQSGAKLFAQGNASEIRMDMLE
jgi:hypothetical protein